MNGFYLVKPYTLCVIMISTKKEVGLVKTFEEEHHIWTIAEVIAFYQKAFPDMDIIKIKLSYKGQFLRYKIIGDRKSVV